MKTLRLLAAIVLTAHAGIANAQDQEPETRAELLLQQRQEKAGRLEPPQQSALERQLRWLEDGRLFERILNPAQGFYPKLGNITPGSGFALGPAYRHVGLLGGHGDAGVFAMVSFQRYWTVEGRLAFPRIADGRVSVDVFARRYEYPNEDFFGLGPASARDDYVTYGLRGSTVGTAGAVRPVPWLALGGSVEWTAPRVMAATAEPRSIRSLFDDADAPGLDARRDFIRYEASAEVNTREPRGNPRRGFRHALAYQHYADRDDGHYSFQRLEADVQHYISLYRERRVLALRAHASVSDADGGEIPFYLQRTLGGPDDLRGFRRFRFRDRHLLLLQAEYRFEIFSAVDGALFYDAGKVASRIEDLTIRNLESNYGIGVRFGSSNGVFARVEGAFGSRGGPHFILRFGNVF